MIFLSLALKSEANPLIEHYKLKQESCNGSFRIFSKDDIKLIVTGSGGISSTIGTTYLLTKYNARKTDILINIGLSGCNFVDSDPKRCLGNLFIINSVKNIITGRNHYPDMILKTLLPEASLITLERMWKNDNIDYEFTDKVLIDMEGAYIYETASKFLYSHNIFILKIISDFGDKKFIPHDLADKLIGGKITEISRLIDIASKWLEYSVPCNPKNDNNEFIEEISNRLMLTGYQIIEFRKLYGFYFTRNINGKSSGNVDAINKNISDLVLNYGVINEKKEGKMLYGKIRKILSE